MIKFRVWGKPNDELKITSLITNQEAENLGYPNIENRWRDEDDNDYESIIKKYIVTNNIRKKGSWHQKDGIFLFSNNKIAMYGQRGWGYLLAEIWEEHDGIPHDYTEFYIGDPAQTKEEAIERHNDYLKRLANATEKFNALPLEEQERLKKNMELVYGSGDMKEYTMRLTFPVFP
jgi:hypothetical protein